MSARYRPAGADWIRVALKIYPSPLGAKVADLLGFVYGGIYNSPLKPEKVDWTNTHHIRVTVSGELATTDFNQLTKLVFGAHAMGVRVSISACNPQLMELLFHLRDGSEGRDLHPTIDQAVEQFRQYYGYLEQHAEVSQ